MTQKDVDLILEFQTCSVVHPLTCGKNSGHFELYPHLDSNTGVVTLVCVNCDYIQKVDDDLMAMVRATLPGAREIEDALKAVPIMREMLKGEGE